MISIAICDDDSNMRSCLKLQTERFMESFGEKIYIEDFSDAQICLEQLYKKNFNLLLLDIEMPNMNGFSMAKEIKKNLSEITIVFVSSHENLVFDSYEFDALWFVRKRILEMDLNRAFRKYMDCIYYDQLSFVVKNKTESYKILYKNVLYFESCGHDIFIKTMRCTYKMGGSLRRLEEELKRKQFARIHKSFLVNVSHIYSINVDTITLADKSTIPLSKERRAEVRKKFFSRGEHIMG